MSDKPTLNDRATDYELHRWATVRFSGMWAVCAPGDMRNSFGQDREFETFAEAIDYAQKQARS